MSNKIKLDITGLHCKACEIISEETLKKIKNVQQATVNYRTGEAEIIYDQEPPSQKEIETRLKEIGYQLNSHAENKKDEAPSKTNYQWLFLVLTIIAVYYLISRTDSLDFGSFLGQKDFSLSLALLVGLVAGVSTCLALVGGLVLGVTANFAKNHPESNRFKKFQPQIIFNLGRIGGFFILGGLLGLIGSGFSLSPLANGLLVLLTGLVIMFLGLKLLNIFPELNDLNISFPKKFGQIPKTNNSLILGALTFFLPCGFTQAMQIYALNTGNFIAGGLVMALFALGTAPGLLGLGGLATLIKTSNSKAFFRVMGVIIIIFALFNINNGFKLIQISAPSNYQEAATEEALSSGVEIKNNIQVVTMAETNRGYAPNKFTILKDVPVRWIIDARAPYSCASALIVPALNIKRQLKSGENIIEFTPTKIGTIPFSCSMGMYTGSFTVTAK